MKKLSLMDSLFFQLERWNTPMHIGSLQIYRYPEGYSGDFYQDLLQSFRSSSELASPFNLKPCWPQFNMGLPSWVFAEDQAMDDHVHQRTLAKPGTIAQLVELASELHGTALDRTRPLWEAYLINGLEDNRFAIYFKIHHAYCDGIAGMNLIKNSLSVSAEVGECAAPWHKKRRLTPDGSSSTVDDSKSAVSALDRVSGFRVMTSLITALVGAAVQSFFSKNRKTLLPFMAPPSILNATIGEKRIFQAKSFLLDDFRQVGRAEGATINDLVMAVCGGALRRYLADQNALGENALVAMVPVAVDAKNGRVLGNQVGNIYCSLGTHIEDPLERLQAVQRSAKEGKEHIAQLPGRALSHYTIVSGFPVIVSQLLNLGARFSPPFNLIVSNVPGPDSRLFLNGAKLESVYPLSAMLERQALNITVTSYCDSLDFGLIACRKSVPHLSKIADYLQDAFDELKMVKKREESRNIL